MLSAERQASKAFAISKGVHLISIPVEEMDEKTEDAQRHSSLSIHAADLVFVARLKACISQQDLQEGIKVHNDVLQNGVFERNPLIGNCLVNMYSKCGELGNAQRVFDELPLRDVVSWTALISGYAQHGHGKQALHLFEQMQSEGVTPDVVTFACALKACAISADSERGKKIHAEIVKMGHLDADYVLGNALLDMYVKCHAIEDAQNVFDNLPNRTVISWTTLIQGYCMDGDGEKALHCYEWMQREGLSPNMLTFSFILKACGSIRSAERGQEVFAEIVKTGLMEGNVVLGNALVDMYARSGAVGKARKVFEELFSRDDASWTALIAGYCQHGHDKEALICFDNMQRENHSLDAGVMSSLLHACTNIGAVKRGERIHAYILKKGSLCVVGNMLVDMYAKCGVLAKAQIVFEELPSLDVIAWTSLISGYAQHGYAEEALNSFEKMQEQNLFVDDATLSCALKASGSIAAGNKGIDLHSEIARKGLHGANIVLGNALIDLYAKCGALTKAQEVFDDLIFHDIVSWNTLIAAYVQSGDGEGALECFEKMLQEGLYADEVTFSCLVKACSTLGAAEKGEEIYSEIARRGLLEKNTFLGNALVDMYSKCGALRKAEEVFNGLLVTDVVAWTALMEGYCESNHSEQAICLFDKMQSVGLSPTAVTFLSALRACGNLGAAERGKELHDKIVQEGLLPGNCALGAALVDMYAKCGAVERAQQIFDELSSHNVVSWTALIAGYAQVGKHKTGLLLFKRMIQEGVNPNHVTFIVVLNSCSHLGWVNEGEIHFTSMEARYGITPSSEHQTCMVDLFGRAGLFDKAMSIIKKMPSNCFPAWFTLLGACQKWGDVKFGRLAFEQAIRLDKGFDLAYDCMSSIYARAGMQEEAIKIEALRTRAEDERNELKCQDMFEPNCIPVDKLWMNPLTSCKVIAQ